MNQATPIAPTRHKLDIAQARRVLIHRRPAAEGYAEASVLPGRTGLALVAAPTIVIALDQLFA